MSFARSFAFVLTSALFACATPTQTPTVDAARPRDLAGAAADLGTVDLGTLDSSAPDLAADLASADLTTSDLLPPQDLVPPGKDPGESCAADADCASRLCRAVVAGGGKVCVAPCKTQAECASYVNLFCEATTAGSPTGWCVPRSPAHCASCAKDADCGGAAERCIKGPGDPQPACHIDCALAGDDACPPDYACTTVQDGTTPRRLCVPRPVAGVPVACLDALGGWCERVGLPIPCVRTSQAGTCTGQRACIQATRRFDKCSATTPQYKMSCSDQDPAGCVVQYAPGIATTKDNCGTCGTRCGASQDCCSGACTTLGTQAHCARCGNACGAGWACCSGACTQLDTIQNCGACGKACPGQTATSDAQCAAGQCDMTCRGESYDVDKSATNGCEQLHPTPPGSAHTNNSAWDLGGKGACDGASQTTFSSRLLSDARLHNPAVLAFNATVGSAPDVWKVTATGTLACVNDYDVTFTVSGGGNTSCYRLTVTTSRETQSVTTTGNGSARIDRSCSGVCTRYDNNTPIFFTIEKTCSLPVQESVAYTVSFHL